MQRKPQKSLRTILMLWFLVFSLVPLFFVTGYSLRTYEIAINNEVIQRLEGNAREISVIIGDYRRLAVNASHRELNEPALGYYLATNNAGVANRLATEWIHSRSADRISVFNHDGRFLASVYLTSTGEVKSEPNLQNRELDSDFLTKVAGRPQLLFAEVSLKKVLNLVVFSTVRDQNGKIAGYIEAVIGLNQRILDALKKRMNLDVAVLDGAGDVISATNPDLLLLPSHVFKARTAKGTEASFGLTIAGNPYEFLVRPLQWGKQKFYIALGASKTTSNAILRKMAMALVIVGLVVILLLILTSLVSSRLILKPLKNLVDATQSLDQSETPIVIPVESSNEIGVLSDSFNEMSRRIAQARSELQAKIRELESAYSELKDTQARLVHSAKMASLGQLVAGIAHELNNPIGFIYSNMSHLKDYAAKLFHIIEVAESNSGKIDDAKYEAEYNYIVEDMPRLIKSCEEGAKRTRDIVLGLRNFSRLEEAKVQRVNIQEGIENTLALISGDIKNRVRVTTDFRPVPEILCYPSQLNQVFMNILTNAAQAIDKEGEIHITVEPVVEKGLDQASEPRFIRISIRDSGKGMSPEMVDKIFDPFFTTKSVGQGTGLGLSISYGIVKNHNGEIQVSSEIGKGTEFAITLPVDGPGK